MFFKSSFVQNYSPRLHEFKNELMDKMRDFHDNKEDGVMMISPNTLKNFNLRNIPHRRLSISKNRFFMRNMVLFFRKKSIVRDLFSAEFGWLNQAGLIQFWMSKYRDDRRIKSNQRTLIERSNLQIETLYGTLQISAVLYSISFIVFILEVISVIYLRITVVLDFLTY